MQRKSSWVLIALMAVGSCAMSGCVIAPPRARVVAVVPARAWVPGYWGHGHVWVEGYWRYR